MKYLEPNHPLTGVLTPLTTLKSQKSEGVGDFYDLKPLGQLVLKTNTPFIQILPINDTGDDPSPYNALSAFALHPLYLRMGQALKELKLSEELGSKYAAFFDSVNSGDYDYWGVLKEKETFLQEIQTALANGVGQVPKTFVSWVSKQKWLKPYAVFKFLKAQHKKRAWFQWDEKYHQPSETLIEELWKAHREELDFICLVQFLLHNQLRTMGKWLDGQSIVLKGDIPILINEDSADVWFHRELFNMDLRAGAPPDMSSQLGQNWGFPTYRWDVLEKQDYTWWKERLLYAQNFFHAFRIDHVLGFFRIWSVPKEHESAVLGFFNPAVSMSREELHSIGFDQGRIHWLAEPHLSSERIHTLFRDSAFEVIASCFKKLGNEELYVFKDSIKGEKDILSCSLPHGVLSHILAAYRDRALVQVDDDHYVPSWYYYNCSRFSYLSNEEKARFHNLVSYKARESEVLWEHQGRRLLQVLIDSTDMLACAEDLGVIPESVPMVLEQLGIFGLKIPRWYRRYGEPGDPFVPFAEYPEKTVMASSVHDTSTLRGWWEREDDSKAFSWAFGIQRAENDHFDEATAKEVFERLLSVGSKIAVFQIQDIINLDTKYRSSSIEEERVNVPGTVGGRNWHYRLPDYLENLSKNKGLVQYVASTVSNIRTPEL